MLWAFLEDQVANLDRGGAAEKESCARRLPRLTNFGARGPKARNVLLTDAVDR